MFIPQLFSQNLFNLPDSRPLGHMSNDNMLIVQLANQLGELVDINMPAGIGPFDMLGVKKCTLRNKYLTLCDIIQLRKIYIPRIAKICYYRNIQRPLDSDALLLQLDNFPAG